MDVIEQVEKTGMLGRDFLVWLWFKSEINHGLIDLKDDGQAEIRFDGKITLETEDKENVETVTCSGVNSQFREARFALFRGKKVTQASMRLILGDDEFSFTMDSGWMNYRSFKTPKILEDYKDDPEGLFYEKAGLIEKAISTIDTVYYHFLKLRVSPEWNERELPAIKKWVKKGRNESHG
ncbi:hypothetical protein ACFL1Z_04715 [Thermodesulfobacteriota bacterium]